MNYVGYGLQPIRKTSYTTVFYEIVDIGNSITKDICNICNYWCKMCRFKNIF